MFFRFASKCLVLGLLLPVCMTGCSKAMRDFNRAPEFSPVRADIGYQDTQNHLQDEAANRPRPKKYSLYQASNTSFYRDPRATHPGDILTVLISINDQFRNRWGC